MGAKSSPQIENRHMKTFGQLVRQRVDELRQNGSRPLSIKSVADLSKLSGKALEKWANGQTPEPLRESVEKVFRAVGLDASDAYAEYLQLREMADRAGQSEQHVETLNQKLASARRSLTRTSLSEIGIFETAKSPLFDEVPVALAPSSISTEDMDPLWTFHEDNSGKTNKIRVMIGASSDALLGVDDVVNLKEIVLRDLEISEKDRREIRAEIHRITEKSNPYLRLRSLELEERDKKSGTNILTLRCDPSDYQVGALAATLKRLGSSADQIRNKLTGKNVHSLAIRIALVSISAKSMQRQDKKFVDNEREIILHRRTSTVFTYRRAWDVSAAGYIDRLLHLSDHDERRIEISKAARAEINEELGIPTWLLPTEEHFEFFGLTQNVETGQTDIVGQVHVDANRFEQIWNSKNLNKKEVEEVKRINLTPDAIARFLSQKEIRMVPSALTTMLLCLRHAGFSSDDIISELRSVVDQVHLHNGFAAHEHD